MALHKYPSFTDLSHELLCHIFQYLPLKEVLSISMLCQKLLCAVNMHLRLCRNIDFCEGKIYGYMPSSITDDHMHSLFKKCPNLESVYGLHPLKVERRRLRKRSALTVPGIIEALSLCCNLKSIETSDLRLLEAILQHLPQLIIVGHFQNRDGMFPPLASTRLKLSPYPRIASLHLTGVEVPELTAMPHLEHLHLHCVRFTKLQPFRAFLATKLKTFVMKHCIGPSSSLRYLSLIIALSSSPALTRLELVRVPLPGGLFQRAVEDSYRHNGFVNLKILVIAGCKGVLEADLGHLMIVASKNLERISIQPSLTRDSLFVSLSFAQCEFPKLKNLHLGYVDTANSASDFTNDALTSLGFLEVPDIPSSLTDSGMKVISQLFRHIQIMSVSNCPHLMAMDQWSPIDGEQSWKELTDLTLQRCHCLQLPSFALFLAFLPKIEVVILNDMFREPPKGCSHVGLSAGTGLGMSSAVVSNQDEHIAVQGHQQDFELQPDDHLDIDDIDRDFMDVDNDENPDQHIMVLQQEFFDEENVVPAAAIRHIRPDNRIENMNQNVPENRIRRELNQDYDSSIEEDSEEDSPFWDRFKSYSGGSEHSGSGDNGLDDHCYTKRRNIRSRKYRAMKSKRVSRGDSLYASQPSCSSDDDDDVDLVNNDCPGTLPNGDHNYTRKTNLEQKGKCSRAKECRNKCSKGFDPNQPSTSKGGNCLDCTCTDSDTEVPKPPKDDPGNKINIKTEIFTDEEMQSSSKKAVKNDSKNSQNEIVLNNIKKEVCDDFVQDTLPTRRKRCLSEDVKYTPPTCKQLRRNELGNQDSSNHLPPEANCIGQGLGGNFAVHNNFIKVEDSTLIIKDDSSDKKNARPKRRRRHRRKRCRKYGTCDRSCYNRGPLTRSRKNKCLQDGYVAVSQGTQATSADIRRSLRKQRNCSTNCKKRGNGSCGSSHRRSHSHISAREDVKKPPRKKPNPDVHNKSTSTSDPLMEDDAVQTLRLVSETLISLTIISCGISDIVIDHCHSMTHVEVQACRILKMFQLHYCPSLKRLNVSQCPKLTLEAIVPEVLSLAATRKLLVSYEPCMQSYFPTLSERTIFSRAPLDQSIILFHDFTNNPSESLQAAAKENLLRWMECVQKLYYTPNFLLKQKKKIKKPKEILTSFPYGHYLRRIHGFFSPPSSTASNGTEWKYQILTNDHVFASALEHIPWVDGFPCPEMCEIRTEGDVLVSMIENELKEKSLNLRKKLVSFYIPNNEIPNQKLSPIR